MTKITIKAFSHKNNTDVQLNCVVKVWYPFAKKKIILIEIQYNLWKFLKQILHNTKKA